MSCGQLWGFGGQQISEGGGGGMGGSAIRAARPDVDRPLRLSAGRVIRREAGDVTGVLVLQPLAILVHLKITYFLALDCIDLGIHPTVSRKTRRNTGWCWWMSMRKQIAYAERSHPTRTSGSDPRTRPLYRC